TVFRKRGRFSESQAGSPKAGDSSLEAGDGPSESGDSSSEAGDGPSKAGRFSRDKWQCAGTAIPVVPAGMNRYMFGSTRYVAMIRKDHMCEYRIMWSQ